ncbi:YbaK/EbsC family protein [Candidatus Woesearchaeota archaeon]|nr:YbaK/EbsC family protein [Candidatus Woesearchaeota archaeon]
MSEHLLDFAKQKDVLLKRIVFKDSVKDSKMSAEVTGIDLSRIVKTVLFSDKHNKNYAVIIRGSERVSRAKLKSFFDVPKLEIVKFEDVIIRTGFPAGGVPPFGYDANFVMDSDLNDEEVVLVGGGTIYSLIEIKVKDIKKLCNPFILDVKQ